MESKKMMQKEINFFKAKKAPKSMIKHEQAEMKSKKFAKGGFVRAADGLAQRGKTRGKNC